MKNENELDEEKREDGAETTSPSDLDEVFKREASPQRDTEKPYTAYL